MRFVLGANTFRQFQHFLGAITRESEADDPVNTRMKFAPTTVVSHTIDSAPEWPEVRFVRGDAADIVRRLKADSPVPLRSHGSVSLNRSLMTAGLVDFVQVTIVPVLTGATGTVPIFSGASDFDLELEFGPLDFTQVNLALNRDMVAQAMRLLDPQPGERIADLFCGIGNFSLPLARRGPEETPLATSSEAMITL